MSASMWREIEDERDAARAEAERLRKELKAAQHVGQLAARDRDNALAERNRWQDRAYKLDNELKTLRAAVREADERGALDRRRHVAQALLALVPSEPPR